MNDRKLPENPLAFIKACVVKRKIFWSYHVNMRLEERAITRDMIVKSTESYELIEAYPEDKYLPSYLVLTAYENQKIHVLFAADVEQDNVRVITAYVPDPDEWDEMFKERNRP